ncbi:hypothetical protein LJ221_21230, partial [Streptomyces sp. CNQ085]|nr:hypothetical protein [Streptomyces sp. CNQ085]
MTTRDGARHRRELPLGDKPGPQSITAGISEVKTVRLVLAEVEFFRRDRPAARSPAAARAVGLEKLVDGCVVVGERPGVAGPGGEVVT